VFSKWISGVIIEVFQREVSLICFGVEKQDVCVRVGYAEIL
jgi:hypothetical protein